VRKTPYTKADYISNKTIRLYMDANIQDHVDPLTGEVNATSLSEDACTHFDCFDGDEIPDKLFTLAQITATRYEIKTGIRESTIPNSLGGLINSRDADWF